MKKLKYDMMLYGQYKNRIDSELGFLKIRLRRLEDEAVDVSARIQMLELDKKQTEEYVRGKL